MSQRLVWLFVFVALYASYCVFWGLASGRGARTGQAFFLADRQIPAWVFAVAATAASFTGWAVIGLPAMILHDGFPAAPLTLGAIVIPLGGVLFLKRQWMLSRRYGYVTPAEMFSDYYGGQVMRLAVLLVALLFALPFLGIQLAASGYLIEILTAGAVPWVFAMWVMAALVFLYVCLGGLRAASYVGVLQGLLFAAAIAGVGGVAWSQLGGMAHFVDLLAASGTSKLGPHGAQAPGQQAGLVARYLALLAVRAPWFSGLLAVAVLAAVQATAALYASATGTMFARDVYRHFLNPTATETRQRLFGRIGVGATLLFALLLATFLPHTGVELGMLALGAGLQLLPAMAGLCWLPWVTRLGAASGLVAGLVAVVFTDQLGVTLTRFIGVQLPWGRWPWTIHSAGWGIACNVAVCLLISLLDRRDPGRTTRPAVHDFLAGMGQLAGIKAALRPVAWALALAWFFFALGPGLIFGTWLFGAPGGGAGGWVFGIPSLWAWQIVWWALGVLLLWLLAYKLEFSTPPRGRIEPLTDSIRLRL